MNRKPKLFGVIWPDGTYWLEPSGRPFNPAYKVPSHADEVYKVITTETTIGELLEWAPAPAVRSMVDELVQTFFKPEVH